MSTGTAWSELKVNGKTWRDMPGAGDDHKRMNFALWRRGKLELDSEGKTKFAFNSVDAKAFRKRKREAFLARLKQEKEDQSFTMAPAAVPPSPELDHGSGILNVNGHMTNFKIEGNKVCADWHLLESHPNTPRILELAAESDPPPSEIQPSFPSAPPLEPAPVMSDTDNENIAHRERTDRVLARIDALKLKRPTGWLTQFREANRIGSGDLSNWRVRYLPSFEKLAALEAALNKEEAESPPGVALAPPLSKPVVKRKKGVVYIGEINGVPIPERAVKKFSQSQLTVTWEMIEESRADYEAARQRLKDLMAGFLAENLTAPA